MVYIPNIWDDKTLGIEFNSLLVSNFPFYLPAENTMTELLSNGWAVGVGGGVLSGLIVAWLTKILFSNKENKEISLAISAANREILYALRAEISEDVPLPPEIINSLRNATARKYGIESRQLFSVSEIGEELIKEIMDSSFISSKQKRIYCQALRTLREDTSSNVQDEISNSVFKARLEYRERMIHLISVTFGSIAALMTLYLALKNLIHSESFVGQLMAAVIPTIGVIGIFVLLMTAIEVALKLRNKRIKLEKELAGMANSDVKNQL